MPAGTAVYTDSGGHLGTILSSRRFKRDIEDMGDRTDAFMRLRPVTFRYNADLDAKGELQFGLIAESCCTSPTARRAP